MSKIAKIWLIIATSLLLVGCMIFGGVMTVLNWDFTKLQTIKYETNSYDINDTYKNISIVTDTADIIFVPSQNEGHSVVCYERENAKHSVSVKDGVLVIDIEDTRKWYEHLKIAFSTPQITVYIPQCEYGSLSIESSTGDIQIPKEFRFKRMDISESTGNVAISASVLDTVKIKASTGNICFENAHAGSLDISVSTGKVTVSDVICKDSININVTTGKVNLTNIECKDLISNGDTGNISLYNVVAEEMLSINRSTGDVSFDGSDAAEILVTTDTGDVKGSLLTDKVFITHTDTGRVDVPKIVTGGKCEISTNTGNIELEIM